MMTNPRIVFDTNVLISAALSLQGTPRKVLDWAASHGTILSSAETLHEFITRMRRPKFEPYVDPAEREAYIEWVVLHADLIEVDEDIQACRDPDDNKFLELAISGGADVIISGDSDLTALHPFQEIPILSPDQFLESEFLDE